MQITVYSPLVSDCREAKRFLDRRNLPYTEINIETTPGAVDEIVKHTGKRAIPSSSSMENGSSPTFPARVSSTRNGQTPRRRAVNWLLDIEY